jgi:anti-sigma factor RsiW
MNMSCNEIFKTQALFDGELVGGEAEEAERHARSCAECEDLLGHLAAGRTALRSELSYFGASEFLRARIANAISAEASHNVVRFPGRVPPFWRGLTSGALGMAAAAAIAAFVFTAPESDALISEVTNAHIRSMIGTHLVDVASTDPSRTEQWLKLHTGVTSPVADASSGFRLVGGRADYVYGASSAVSVYRRGSHTVNVFAWTENEDETLPEAATSKGYNIVLWKRGTLVFCAISNIPHSDLEKLASALRRQTA